MGNYCCNKGIAADINELRVPKLSSKTYSHYAPPEKPVYLDNVIRIQALFRGCLARNQVHTTFGFLYKHRKDHLSATDAPTNYDNSLVQSIRHKLGPFVYGSS